MLYPARWKKITVGQSKVLKHRLYRLFRFLGATRYTSSVRYITHKLGVRDCQCTNSWIDFAVLHVEFIFYIINTHLLFPWNLKSVTSCTWIQSKVPFVTIGLSASITFKIVSQSKYALRLLTQHNEHGVPHSFWLVYGDVFGWKGLWHTL